MSSGLIAVCGPTASGKSDISIALARELNAEILNFDASQAFIGADIGTAKISSSQRNIVRHHLIDLITPDSRLQAGAFIEEAENAIKRLDDSRTPAIICAGSTMYLARLIEGIAETGIGDPEYRRSLEAMSAEDLYSRLLGCDPERAQSLHPNDKIRIIRALEINHVTGRTASELYRSQQAPLNRNMLMIILCWNREELADRINRRVDQMLGSGLIEECRAILDRYGEHSQIFSSIGYAETLKYLRGEIDQQTLKEEISLHTRQLAKRQMTFLRRFPVKHEFTCQPLQTLETAVSPQAGRNKARKHEFDAKIISFNDLKGICSDFLTCKAPETPKMALYLRAANLLEAIAVD